MLSDELREVQRAIKNVKKIAREVSDILHKPDARANAHGIVITSRHQSRTLPRGADLPEQYSFVLCDTCSDPAVVLRDNAFKCFVACCLRCNTITYFESIIEDTSE